MHEKRLEGVSPSFTKAQPPICNCDDKTAGLFFLAGFQIYPYDIDSVTGRVIRVMQEYVQIVVICFVAVVCAFRMLKPDGFYDFFDVFHKYASKSSDASIDKANAKSLGSWN